MAHKHNRRRGRPRHRHNKNRENDQSQSSFGTASSYGGSFSSYDSLSQPPSIILTPPNHYASLPINNYYLNTDIAPHSWQLNGNYNKSSIPTRIRTTTDRIEEQRLRIFGGEPGDDIGLCDKMMEAFVGMDWIDS